MERLLQVGSRESPLALAQAHQVIALLQAAWPKLTIELKTFKTQGDIVLDTALSKIGDKGLFVKELEQAMLQGEIDVAVHSCKDLPSVLPWGLAIHSAGPREDARDVLISKEGLRFQDLPSGAVVGTSSLRRVAQLKRLRPDLKYRDIRGNLQTRLSKLEEGSYQAIVLAAAGVHRLGWQDKIIQYFDPATELLPAVAQGILAIEFREDDAWTRDLLQGLVVPEVETAMLAERAVLRTLEGGCQVPMGAYAQLDSSGYFALQAIVLNLEGTQWIADQIGFQAAQAEVTCQAFAHQLLEQGAKAILHGIQVPSQTP